MMGILKYIINQGQQVNNPAPATAFVPAENFQILLRYDGCDIILSFGAKSLNAHIQIGQAPLDLNEIERTLFSQIMRRGQKQVSGVLSAEVHQALAAKFIGAAPKLGNTGVIQPALVPV